MLFVSSADVLATVLIAVAILVGAAILGRVLGFRPSTSLGFAATVLILSYARYSVELSSPADAFGYYTLSLTNVGFDIGTNFMPYLTSFLTLTLGMGFLPAMMFFGLFSLVAVQFFYAAFLRVTERQLSPLWHIAFLTIVVPSTAFWGSGISKDAIVLMGIALFCWGVVKEGRRLAVIIPAVLLVFIVRPHIGILMMFGQGAGFVFSRDSKASERVTVAVLAAGATLVLMPLALDYVGFSDISSLSDVNERVNTIATGFQDSNSYVDLSEMSFPAKFVSYLFRPFLWEAGSIPQRAVAVQNVILFVLLARMLPNMVRQWRELRTRIQITFLVYSVAALVVLALTTANLGVSARQKWMVIIPFLLVLMRSWALRETAVGWKTIAPRLLQTREARR